MSTHTSHLGKSPQGTQSWFCVIYPVGSSWLSAEGPKSIRFPSDLGKHTGSQAWPKPAIAGILQMKTNSRRMHMPAMW